MFRVRMPGCQPPFVGGARQWTGCTAAGWTCVRRFVGGASECGGEPLRRGRRGGGLRPGQALKILREPRDGIVEIAVVSLLQERDVHFLGECPEDVMAGTIVDFYGDGGQRVGRAL